MPDKPMTLGELKAQLDEPRLFGVVDTLMDDSRDVVVQVPVGEHPVFGTQYEYYRCRAAGVLFVDGSFVIVIAAGDRIGGPKTEAERTITVTNPSTTPASLVECFQAIGVPIQSLNEPGAASIFAPRPEGTGVATYDEATALGSAELAAGRWRSFRVEKFYKMPTDGG